MSEIEEIVQVRSANSNRDIAQNTQQVVISSINVFLSYNHDDGETVIKIKNALEFNGVTVRVDTNSMLPGTEIQNFILESIRTTDVTLCIVSEKSLLSGWVAMETLQTLAKEAVVGKRFFIACYIDDGFFDKKFRLRATDAIDQKIKHIDDLIPTYNKKYLDTDDLNEEKSRLHELRNNLGKILKRLRASLVIDMRPSNFDEGLESLVKTLREYGLDENHELYWYQKKFVPQILRHIFFIFSCALLGAMLFLQGLPNYVFILFGVALYGYIFGNYLFYSNIKVSKFYYSLGAVGSMLLSIKLTSLVMNITDFSIVLNSTIFGFLFGSAIALLTYLITDLKNLKSKNALWIPIIVIGWTIAFSVGIAIIPMVETVYISGLVIGIISAFITGIAAYFLPNEK